MEKLIDFAEEGNTLRTHDDVPDGIHQLLCEQEEPLSEHKRPKQMISSDLPAPNIHLCCPGHSQGPADSCVRADPGVQDELLGARSANLVIPKPRDKAFMRCRPWYCNQIDGSTRKKGLLHADQATKEACLDLKHVHEAQDTEFYTKSGLKLT